MVFTFCIYFGKPLIVTQVSASVARVIFELFFCKKIPLSRHVGYVIGGWISEWISGSVDQWISGSVRDVCLSHQSD